MTGFLVLLPSGPKNTNNFQTNHTSAQAGYKAFKFVLWKSKTYYFYTQLHLMLLNCRVTASCSFQKSSANIVLQFLNKRQRQSKR